MKDWKEQAELIGYWAYSTYGNDESSAKDYIRDNVIWYWKEKIYDTMFNIAIDQYWSMVEQNQKEAEEVCE